jgi:hypothetical protein
MSAVKPIQNPLSLVLKLKSRDGKPGEPPQLVNAQSEQQFPDILHFAWVISLASVGQPSYALLTTVYDGDFDVYLDKFIDSNHAGFDALFPSIEDAPPTPVLDNRQAFHDWVRKNNISPLPVFFSAYPTMSVSDIRNC